MKRKKIITEMSVNITSMMDMFTIILVFLLNSFGASAIDVQISKDLDLAKSSSTKPPTEITIIIVDTKNIIVDGKTVLTHDNGKINSAFLDESGFMLKPLYDELKDKADKAKYIQKNNTTFEFEGKVLLQMHKELPFDLLRKVMYSAGQAEYSEFKFMALKKG